MRINEKDIETALTKLLTEGGFNVVAGEVTEGFKKPAVFLSVSPSRAELQNPYLELVNCSVEVKYIPSTETVVECLTVSETICRILLYTPLRLGTVYSEWESMKRYRWEELTGEYDRHITVQSVEYEIEKYVLYVYFDVEFYQPTPKLEEEYEYEEITNLQIGGI